MKVNVKEIEITRAEGLIELCGITKKFSSWKEADMWLESQQHTLPKSGASEKHDFKITWMDGTTYTGTLNCTQAIYENPDLSVINHIKDKAAFYIDNATTNPHISEETCNMYLNLLENYL